MNKKDPYSFENTDLYFDWNENDHGYLFLSAWATKKSGIRIYYQTPNDAQFSARNSVKIILGKDIKEHFITLKERIKNLKIEFEDDVSEITLNQIMYIYKQDTIQWVGDDIINEFRFINCKIGWDNHDFKLRKKEGSESRPFIVLDPKGLRRIKNIFFETSYIKQTIEVSSKVENPSTMRIYYTSGKNNFDARESYVRIIRDTVFNSFLVNPLTDSSINRIKIEFANDQENEIQLGFIKITLNNRTVIWNWDEIISEFRFSGFSKVKLHDDHLTLVVERGEKNGITISPIGIKRLTKDLQNENFLMSTLIIRAKSLKDITCNVFYRANLSADFSNTEMYQKIFLHSDNFQEYQFPLLTKYPIKNFRLDFGNIPDNEIIISEITFKDATFSRTWSSDELSRKFKSNSYLTIKDKNIDGVVYLTKEIWSICQPSLKLNSELISKRREKTLLISKMIIFLSSFVCFLIINNRMLYKIRMQI